MKVGDLVRFQNLFGWGPCGLIVEIRTGVSGVGHIHLLTKDGFSSIPFVTRDKYMKVINENR